MLKNRKLLIGLVVGFVTLGSWACENGSGGYGTSETRNATPTTTPGGATGSQTDRNQLTPADRELVMKAASGNRHEVALGRPALERASTREVKAFANLMIQDHSLAYDEITQLASRRSISVALQDDAMFREKVDKLSKLKGAEFDREYMNEMVEDHVTDVGEFDSFASSGQNEELRNWATRTLPI